VAAPVLISLVETAQRATVTVQIPEVAQAELVHQQRTVEL
jgi:hypothetical protein